MDELRDVSGRVNELERQIAMFERMLLTLSATLDQHFKKYDMVINTQQQQIMDLNSVISTLLNDQYRHVEITREKLSSTLHGVSATSISITNSISSTNSRGVNKNITSLIPSTGGTHGLGNGVAASSVNSTGTATTASMSGANNPVASILTPSLSMRNNNSNSLSQDYGSFAPDRLPRLHDVNSMLYQRRNSFASSHASTIPLYATTNNNIRSSSNNNINSRNNINGNESDRDPTTTHSGTPHLPMAAPTTTVTSTSNIKHGAQQTSPAAGSVPMTSTSVTSVLQQPITTPIIASLSTQHALMPTMSSSSSSSKTNTSLLPNNSHHSTMINGNIQSSTANNNNGSATTAVTDVTHPHSSMPELAQHKSNNVLLTSTKMGTSSAASPTVAQNSQSQQSQHLDVNQTNHASNSETANNANETDNNNNNNNDHNDESLPFSSIVPSVGTANVIPSPMNDNSKMTDDNANTNALNSNNNSSSQQDSGTEEKHYKRKKNIYSGYFQFLKSPHSVLDLWREYTEGTNGQPSIKELESIYQTGWRRDPAVNKRFSRRKVLYKAIENGLNRGYTLDYIVDLLEEYRFIDRAKNQKRPIGWLFHTSNIPELLK